MSALTRFCVALDAGNVTVRFALLVLTGICLASGAAGFALAAPFHYWRGFRRGLGMIRSPRTHRL